MKFEIRSPFPEQHLSAMCGWLQEFKYQMVDDASPLEESDVRAFYESGRSKSFAVEVDGQAAGAVWAEELYDGVYMGHLVFDRDMLSSAEKVQATRQAVRKLFEEGARKISWHVFADNRAFRIFLKRVGAEIEGTMRKATKRNGEYVDVMLLSTLPEDLRA